MEPFAFIILGAIGFVHGWSMLNIADRRTTGAIALAGAIALLVVLTVLKLDILTGTRAHTTADNVQAEAVNAAAVSSMVILWALYGGLLGAVNLWELDDRTVGIFSLLLAVGSAFFALYFFLGDVRAKDVQVISAVAGVVNVGLVVLYALLFLYQALPQPRLRVTTAWFFIVFSLLIALTGLAVLNNIVELVPES